VPAKEKRVVKETKREKREKREKPAKVAVWGTAVHPMKAWGVPCPTVRPVSVI